jgi:hypothetical protein
MRLSFFVCALSASTAAMISCGKKKSESSNTPSGASLTLAFASATANSVPQIAPITSSLVGLTTNDINSNTTLKNYFKQECYMPNDAGTSYEGFCPADVKAKLDAAIGNAGIGNNTSLFNQYKLTSTSLIGQIYHAQMYANVGALSNDCATTSASSLATANSPAFENSSISGGTPNKFVISYPTGSKLFSCVKQNTWDGNTTYSAYGFENNALNALTARYGLPYSGTADQQTDIIQVYLAFDSTTLSATTPTPTFLAYNAAAASGSRAVALVNLANHKFAAKYRWGYTQIIAVGTAGVDATTGTRVAGYYIAKVVNSPTSTENKTFCVNNSDNTYTEITDSTACGSNTVPALDSLNASTLMTFLEANSTDTAALTNFSAFFASFTTSNIFSNSEMPSDGLSPFTSCSGTGTYPCYQENKKDFPNIIR